MKQTGKKRIQNNGGNRLTHYGFIEKKQDKQTRKKDKKDIKDRQKKNEDYHESSMQAQGLNSKTEVLSSGGENEFAQQQRPVQVIHQMVMIGPLDVTYFHGIKKRIKDLLNIYTKQQVMKLIMQNTKYENISNLKNLDSIEDGEFWTHTVPKLLEYAMDEKKQKSISSCVDMLTPNNNQIRSFTKAQIFMVLINMFLCTLPKQSHVKTPLNFGKLMTVYSYQSESENSRKLQKFKCIVTYLKQMSKRKFKQLEKEQIQIQRASSQLDQKQFRQIQYRMKQVQIQIGLVEDRDKYDIVVDFANKKIGGGVLAKGAVQEQILFAIYPQLIMAVCICYEMTDNQMIIVYNAQRFSSYSGYSDSFKFQGMYEIDEDKKGPFQSIILAVDAVNFNEEPERGCAQYRGQLIQRELIKFLGGVQATEYKADQSMGVCTGKWGCGIFSGDFYLKFLIQWIACSVANKNMVFMCGDEKQKKQLQAMYNFMKRFNTTQILQIMEQFNQYFQPSKNTQITFIQYLKKYSC